MDDEARFYEERVNPWLTSMLKSEGAQPLLSFRDKHPEVEYVTYDPRSGQELADWLSLVLATADIAVVDPRAPERIVRWVGELTRPHLQTFLLDVYGELGQQSIDYEEISYYRGVCVGGGDPEQVTVSEDQYLIRFGPALPGPHANGHSAQHIEETAARLVDQVASAVDETLINEREERPPQSE